ncbi:MAG: DNA alkylation repair protein [Myxococcota bacterium]
MAKRPTEPLDADSTRLDTVLADLRALATTKTRDGMARFAIPSTHALGVAVGDIRDLGKRIGRDHALAVSLWSTGVYEARMLAAFVDEPARVTPAQMDHWIAETDNWAICDHVCFHLFDRTPHAFARVTAWADRPEEFVKRGAFALLAALALHDKAAPDDAFLACLPLIPRAADDERNFVKKGVSWALRAIGRRNARLNDAAVPVALALAASSAPAPRWVGKDALRELTSAAVVARLARP